MPRFAELEAAAARHHLAVLGGLALDGAEPGTPTDTRTLLLVGPGGAGFWPEFSASSECRDGTEDPLDRWSKRILGALAKRVGGIALFPSDGPPYLPFHAWALKSGSFHASPIRLLVHGADGLLTSLRGALALPFPLELPAPLPSPCDSCESQPCRTACPAGAFGAAGYHTELCHNHLDTPAGSDCMENGCAARRACPVSARSERLPEQSAYHMRAFHGNR